jgi:hypothetical protein
MDNNLEYHLDKLIRMGLVEKDPCFACNYPLAKHTNTMKKACRIQIVDKEYR